jgi:hypothetical protein
MITVTTRNGYTSFVLQQSLHDDLIKWKINSRKKTVEPPEQSLHRMIDFINRFCHGFDCLTVPAPSFHRYSKNYPIWEIAKIIAPEVNLPLVKLFPGHSGKTAMGQFSSITKKMQNINCDPGQFVLILDDIVTTRHTCRVTCEAIANKNSFPCFVAFA